MKIAIIEKDHFEVAYTLICLFDNDKNDITVFAEKESYRQLQLMLKEKINRYTWVIKEENEANRSFITRIFQLLHNDSFDLLYFSTIDDNFIHYANHLQKTKAKLTVLTLHSINTIFHYKPSLSIRRLARYMGKRKLVKKVSAFNVLSQTMVKTLENKLERDAKIFTVPGGFFEPEHFNSLQYQPGQAIEIVVPGSIDTRRRNYESIFELLQTAKQQNINLSLTLLGSFRKGYSENILEKCKQYQQTNNNLHIYSSSTVDQPEFDRVIRKSHFIWMPLQSFTTLDDGIKEQYGVTISSGNIGDVIRHAKPFFASQNLALDPDLEKSCTRYYAIEDIITVLRSMTSENYAAMQQSAHQSSLNYTKEKIIARNSDLGFI
ncbi:MAG: hypothetical protein ABIR18_00460 [Chitinophagaceae bacterium]